MQIDHPRWNNNAVPSFVVQLIISTVGAKIAATLLSLIFGISVAAVTKNTSGGNFADHVQTYGLSSPPYFVLPILVAFAFGALSGRVFTSRSAGWVWVVPAALLAWSVLTWKGSGDIPHWTDVWNNYFGSQCGSSECLYELFVTAPFYTSVAYAIGWALAHGYRVHKAVKV